jgi:hypothetical protein
MVDGAAQVPEGRSTTRTTQAVWVLLLLAVLAPAFIAILWGNIYAEPAYLRFQKARAIARGTDQFWDTTSPLQTILLALTVRLSSTSPGSESPEPMLPFALTLSVVGWMAAIAAWFCVGMALGQRTFAVTAAVLLALNPLQTQVMGLESGLALGLFGLAMLWTVQGRSAALLLTLTALVAVQPMAVCFAVPLLIYRLIWRRASPTLAHIAIIVIVGCSSYAIAGVLTGAWPRDGGPLSEPQLVLPLLISAQILIAIGFSLLVPDFNWLSRPLGDTRGLQQGILSFGLVMLAVGQSWLLLHNWRMRPTDRLALYDRVAGWLQKNALPSEIVGTAQPGVLGYLADRNAVALPETDQASVLLGVLSRSRPDHCVALDSVAWRSVSAQPWFQERYEPVFQADSPYDSAAPLTVFRYTSSPFDVGETVTRTARFTPDTEDWIELTGYRLDGQRITPGEPLHLTLNWHAITAIHQPLFAVVRLTDSATGEIVARAENLTPGGLATGLWNADMQISDRYTLVPPADLKPGDYTLDVALYQHQDGAVPVRAGNRGDVLRREPLKLAQVYRPPDISPTPLIPDHTARFKMEDEIELVGFDTPERIEPGDTLRVTLYWHALQSISTNYKIFVHLQTSNGQLLAQDDSLPVHWSYPTEHWQPGEYVRDEHLLSIDPATPRGEYVLSVGLYDAATGERPVVRDASGNKVPDRRLVLREIQVR